MEKKYTSCIVDEEIVFSLEEIKSNQFVFCRDGQKTEMDILVVGCGHYSVLLDGKSFDVAVTSQDTKYEVLLSGEKISLELLDEKAQKRTEKNSAAVGQTHGDVVSPMPGKVVKVFVEKGQQVKAGDGVVVIEAMKMENEFKAPKDGFVKDVKVVLGQAVEGNMVMVVIE